MTVSFKGTAEIKTVERVFTAKEEELMKVEGVGKERAKKIREVLTAKYED